MPQHCREHRTATEHISGDSDEFRLRHVGMAIPGGQEMSL